MFKLQGFSLFFIGLFIIATVSTSCSSKKTVKKDSSFLTNIGTKFNILYNSERLLKEGIKNTEEGTVDNLQQNLSVFKEPNPISIQTNMELMDSVIGKADRIINEKQESKFVNRALIIKAKASYYQGDYYNAIEFFDYVQQDSLERIKVKQEALLWKIRALLQLGNFSKAASDLGKAIENSENASSWNGLLYAVQAKHYLDKRENTEAIESLSKAIKFSKNKKHNLRWHYLLGQLLFEKGENEAAYQHFSKLAKSNESYEMTFHANIYRIEIINKDNPDIENKVKLLSKLLRDGKNKDYKGQIYQRIGDVYFTENLKDQAIQNYQLATSVTFNNPYQQAINYQKLADLYFNDAKYTQASLYYDSVMSVLPKEDIDYEQLNRKQSHLGSLVKQLSIISYQDTLLKLASLPREEQEKFIDRLIEEEQAAKSASLNPSTAGKLNQFIDDPADNFVQSEESSTFYFSNPAAISQGYSEFRRRWGNRGHVDNWRYSNQASMGSTLIADAQGDPLIEENNMVSDREKYIQDLPDTPEKLMEAENAIKNAYLALGEIYQHDLLDDKASAEAYETYLKRFPIDENSALLCFHLYRLYIDQDPEKSLFYKEKLAKEFPTSKYSLSIQDPAYYKKQQDLLERFNSYYENAYQQFTEQKYQELIQSTDKSLRDQTFNSLSNNLAQLAYLRAISIGRTAGLSDFKSALLSIVDHYPDEEIIVPLVKQHLMYLKENENQFLNKAIALDDINLNGSGFTKEFALTPWPELSFSKEYHTPVYRKEFDVEESKSSLVINRDSQEKSTLDRKAIEVGEVKIIEHENQYRDLKLFPDSATYYFVINVMHGSVNLSPSRYGIGQFNRSQYPAKALQHRLKNVADENQLIYIAVFSSYAEVKAYEAKITPLLSNIMKIPGNVYTHFVITEPVFNTLADFDQIDDYYTLYSTQK